MQTTRRQMLAATGALIAVSAATVLAPGLVTQAVAADAPDPRMSDRGEGSPGAKTVVEEWFSFTCPHCARFSADVYPQISARLIDTGKIRYVFHEFPRDQVDLMAAMVARSLPPSRYVPFVEQLLATQAHWAFDSSVDPKEELAKEAALAGMSREMFDRVTSDEALKAEILGAQAAAEKQYNIESTPTFIINGKAHAGEVDFATFAGWVGA
jgi:protein-disulfide isomerase